MTKQAEQSSNTKRETVIDELAQILYRKWDEVDPLVNPVEWNAIEEWERGMYRQCVESLFRDKNLILLAVDLV